MFAQLTLGIAVHVPPVCSKIHLSNVAGGGGGSVATGAAVIDGAALVVGAAVVEPNVVGAVDALGIGGADGTASAAPVVEDCTGLCAGLSSLVRHESGSRTVTTKEGARMRRRG